MSPIENHDTIADVVVVGGGAAGFTAALFAHRAGARVRMLRRGQGATSLSSGALDICGAYPDGSRCSNPWEGLASWRSQGKHLGELLDDGAIKESLDTVAAELQAAGLPLGGAESGNLWLATTLGTFKPTALALATQARGDLAELEGPVAIAGITGLPTFSGDLVAESLAELQSGGQLPRKPGKLEFRAVQATLENFRDRPYLSEAEVARAWDKEENWQAGKQALKRALEGTGARALGLPPVLGLETAAARHRDLEEELDLPVFELLPLYRSVPGMRLQAALDWRWMQLTGQWPVSGWKVEAVETAATGVKVTGQGPREPFELFARSAVLALGDLVGGGIIATREGLYVPSLDLDLAPGSSLWASPVFPERGHPALGQGLPVDGQWRPFDANGRVWGEGVYAAGAILGGYQPVRELSGLGMAIASGAQAGKRAGTAAVERRGNR